MKKSISVFLCLMTVFGIMGCLSACGGKKLDLADYYSIEITGLNGNARAYVSFDEELFEVEFTDAYTEQLEKYGDTELFFRLIESIDCELDKSKDLKNGDTVTGTVTYDKTAADSMNIAFKTSAVKQKVEGLEDGKVIDVFKDIEVTFSGVSPEANVNLPQTTVFDGLEVSYTCANGRGLKIGDKVTIKASYSNDAAVSKALIIENDTKEYTVEGIDDHIYEDTAISLDDIASIKSQADKMADEYFKGQKRRTGFLDSGYISYDHKLFCDLADAKSVTNQKFSKAILLVPESGYCNDIAFIYSFDTNNLEGESFPNSYGIIVAENVIKKADGSFVCSDVDYVSSCFKNGERCNSYITQKLKAVKQIEIK